jgi:tRNA1Val (adenine37-N6)-methyltransferase
MKVTTDACLFGAWIARELSKESAVQHILDIGTGTGLLSLMVAQQSSAPIDAIEIDSDSCQQAIFNIHHSPWKERIAVIHGNAKDTLHSRNTQYDAIISNPPFYEYELQSGKLQKDMAHHSTEMTLDDLIQLLNSDILNQEGKFYLLLPFKRQQEIDKAFAKANLAITHTVLVRQSTKHNFFRIILAGKKGIAASPAITEELAIRNEADQYTPEFTALLKDYYLYL